MKFALNEIEATARKAARGAGFTWGLAEEAGKATRWLAAQDLPGVEALAGYLTWEARNQTGGPQGLERPWQRKSGPLCPLVTGCLLSDQATTLDLTEPLDLGSTAFPLLLLPFVAGAAAAREGTLEVSWEEIHFIAKAGALAVSAETERFLTASAPLRINRGGDVDGRPPKPGGKAVEGAMWRVLEDYAHQTYVPASEASRLAGAGAGVIDKD